MLWDRYAVGIAVALALLSPAILAAGGLVALAVVFGVLAVLVLAATFAPVLPWLNALPRIGAPQVSVQVSLSTSDETSVLRVGEIDPCVLRVGFVNDGPTRVENVTVNVLVDQTVELVASDHEGSLQDRGNAMPVTLAEDRWMSFWSEQEHPLPVGATLLHYLLSFPDAAAVGDQFLVRVRYGAETLYGRGDRVCDTVFRVIDP